MKIALSFVALFGFFLTANQSSFAVEVTFQEVDNGIFCRTDYQKDSLESAAQWFSEQLKVSSRFSNDFIVLGNPRADDNRLIIKMPFKISQPTIMQDKKGYYSFCVSLTKK